ncbi:MAG: hypothetical protein K2X27_10545 [Candidatus Obscuribacterales bacterium]|nr:hypothetical protein [Candidatus Obscuribacterales bacterium]
MFDCTASAMEHHPAKNLSYDEKNRQGQDDSVLRKVEQFLSPTITMRTEEMSKAVLEKMGRDFNTENANEAHSGLSEELKEQLKVFELGLLKGDLNAMKASIRRMSPEDLKKFAEAAEKDMGRYGLTFRSNDQEIQIGNKEGIITLGKRPESSPSGLLVDPFPHGCYGGFISVNPELILSRMKNELITGIYDRLNAPGTGSVFMPKTSKSHTERNNRPSSLSKSTYTLNEQVHGEDNTIEFTQIFPHR